MGATCWVSVIIQSLIHNPIIRNYFLADGHRANECEERDLDVCMKCAMTKIFAEFFAEDCTSKAYSATNLLATTWNCGKVCI